jgi:predicted lipid-binding transport protein (Tim44 family)
MIKALLIFVLVHYGMLGILGLAAVGGLIFLAWRTFRRKAPTAAATGSTGAAARPFTPQPRSGPPRTSRYSDRTREAAPVQRVAAAKGAPAQTRHVDSVTLPVTNAPASARPTASRVAGPIDAPSLPAPRMARVLRRA